MGRVSPKCEQIFTISKERLGARVGRLSSDDLRRVEDGLRLNLALDEVGSG